MSMLEIKNEKLSEALKKIRDLYPDDSLGDAIIMAVDRIKKAEENVKKYSKEAISAKEKAYEFDKRYCDILVEKRGLEVENKQYKTIVDAHIEKAEELDKENDCLVKLINDQVRWINELKRMLNNLYGEGYIPDYTYPAKEIRRVKKEE